MYCVVLDTRKQECWQRVVVNGHLHWLTQPGHPIVGGANIVILTVY